MNQSPTSKNRMALREADFYRRQLEVVCNNSTLALFIMDEHQQCSYMNPAAEHLTGFTLAEVQGRALHDVVHHTRPDGSHYPMSECPIDRAFPENNQTQGEEIFVHKDGHFYTVAYTASPVRDSGGVNAGISGTIIEVRDITLEKAAQRARQEEASLREGEKRLHFVMDSMHQKVFTARPNGEVDYFNPQWMEFTGLSFEQIRDWGWAQFIHPDDVTENLRVWQQAVSNGTPFEFEHRFRRADGEYRWHLSRAVPIRNEAGQVSMWIGSNTDIARQKQAEAEVRQFNLELELRVVQRTAELAAANQELDAFSYSVSHDLRAPLRAVDGFSQILIQRHAEEFSGKAHEFLQRIRAGTQQMGKLIDDLLAFSRLSRQPINKHWLEPAALVRRCLDELREGQDPQALEFSAGDLPPCEADPALLKQVWVNLLSNALKYTRKCVVARIEVGCRQSDGEVIYYVKDNGVGFDMRYADKLFGVFQRLHRAEDYEGTGVGLAIVQRIVQRHGGRVWVEAAPDQGATFYFTLA